MELKEVSLSEIDPGFRYRSQEDYDLMELLPSVQRWGILQPVTVLLKSSVPKGVQHETDAKAPYLLLAGGRRFYTSKAARLQSIPAAIRHLSELDLTEEELALIEEKSPLVELRVREIELEENIQRKNLNDLDKAKITKEIHGLKQARFGDHKYKKLRVPDKPGWSTSDTAELLKTNRETVRIELLLADEAEKDPEVAAALKNEGKSAAKKVIIKKERLKQLHTATQKIQTQKAATPEDQKRTELAAAYQVNNFFEAIKTEPDDYYGLIELDPDWAIPLKESYEASNRESHPDHVEEYKDINPKEYYQLMLPALKEAYRILRPNGWLFLWFGNKNMREINEKLLIEAGFVFDRAPAIWCKDESAGFTRNSQWSLSNDYETFFYARKSPKANIIKRGRSNRFTFRRVAAGKKIHITEKPVELYQDIFATFGLPGTPTLVGFAGGGNALLAGNNLGNPVKGFDLSEHFKKEFIMKVFDPKVTPGEYKSY